MINGAVAFVTGGGRGIGRAIALALAGAGGQVVVGARTEREIEAVAREVRQRGGQAQPVVCDVTSLASVEQAFECIQRDFGHVDILVNNAGVAGSATVLRTDEELWNRTLAVNLTGTYRCTRAALPGMIERRHGRIINIASVAARTGLPYISAYCASKHGVLGFTRAVALEVAAKGITVNAICPGYVDTDMTTAAVSRIAERTGRSPGEARQALEAMNPQRRLITPDEVAAVALFLAGDEAQGITGQAINIDGGEVMA